MNDQVDTIRRKARELIALEAKRGHTLELPEAVARVQAATPQGVNRDDAESIRDHAHRYVENEARHGRTVTFEAAVGHVMGSTGDAARVLADAITAEEKATRIHDTAIKLADLVADIWLGKRDGNSAAVVAELDGLTVEYYAAKGALVKSAPPAANASAAASAEAPSGFIFSTRTGKFISVRDALTPVRLLTQISASGR